MVRNMLLGRYLILKSLYTHRSLSWFPFIEYWRKTAVDINQRGTVECNNFHFLSNYYIVTIITIIVDVVDVILVMIVDVIIDCT